jgi:hypothetical protein
LEAESQAATYFGGWAGTVHIRFSERDRFQPKHWHTLASRRSQIMRAAPHGRHHR